MQFAINVMVLASTYSLLAIGYVLVYRVSRVLNMAHGELMMLSAYLAFALAAVFPGQPLIVVPMTVGLAALLGAFAYRLIIQRMHGRPVFSSILLTVAMGIAIQGLVSLVWTPRVQYPAEALGIIDQPIPLPLGGVVSTLGLVSIAACGAVLLGLVALFRFSRSGTRMLAAAENPLLVAQRGVDVHALMAMTWAIAVACAAVAGILYSLGNQLEGGIAVIGLKAFPAALVGGLGSVSGVLPGALLVALAEVAAIQFVSPQLSNVAPFLVLLVALLIRPWGLFGTPEQIDRV
jgi:branched-chain amino acid transport system permease protein